MRAQLSIIEEGLGGLEPGFASVVTGPTGSGRTVLALELVHATLARGEPVALLTSEPARLLLQQSMSMSYDFEPAIREGRLALLELDPNVAALTRGHGGDVFYDAIVEACSEARLIVIDSLDAITNEILDEVVLRALLRALFERTAAAGQRLVTTIETSLLDQNPQLARVVKSMCGSLIELSQAERDGEFVLNVAKSRAAGYMSGDLHFRIGTHGPERVDAQIAPVPDAPEPRPTGPTAQTLPAARPVERPTPPAPIAVQEPSPEPRPARETPKLLIVEDDRLTLTQLRDHLSDRYDIITAEDGFAAIKQVFSQQPDLVILELQLPRVNGYEVLSAMREGGARMPVLIVSGALARATDRVRALVLGANDLMRKPVQKFELRMKVRTLLQLAESSDVTAVATDFGSDDVEALLGQGTSMRRLDEPQFIERVGRACRFSEEYGLTSILVSFETHARKRRDELLEAADKTLRAEDAVLALPGDKRGVFLLVSTDAAMVPTILSRLAARMKPLHKYMRPDRYAIFPAEPLEDLKDWDPFYCGLTEFPAAAETNAPAGIPPRESNP